MKPSSYWLFVGMGLAMSALVAGGAWFYLDQQQLVRKEVETDLQAIAELKANQITEWRTRQLGQAALIMESPFFTEAAEMWFANPQAELAEKFLTRFRSMQSLFHYRDVMLVDSEGQVLLSLSNRVGSLHPDAAQGLATAIKERRPVLADLHFGPGDLPPHIDLIAPFFAGHAKTDDPIGAVVFQVDAEQFLYPLISFWPTPRRSAETLLVRSDGDSVLFLNNLRHMPDTALKLRIPLTRTDVPAVMAVLGREGVVQGKDYRDVEVLSVLKAIPDSPWFMIAKMDKTEAFEDWQWRSLLMAAFFLSVLTALAAAGGTIWQRNAKAHYQMLYEAEAALRMIEARYRVTLMSVGDGVIATDTEARVELLNHVAEELTGWGQEEAFGKPLAEIFRIVNEETLCPVENPVGQALTEGIVVGLANHTVLIAKDGTQRPIADSAAPIRDENGVIIGVVLVFRDQTEERARQKRVEFEKERARQYLDVAGVMMLALDTDGNVVRVNRKGCRMLGYEEQDILGKNWFEHFVPERVRDRGKGIFSEIIRGQRDNHEYAESYILTRNGEERIVAWHNSILRGQDGPIIGTLSSGQDITERRHYEEALRQSENSLKRSQEIAHLGSWSLDLKANRLAWSDEVYRIFGLQPQEFEATYNGFLDAVHPEDRAVVDAAYSSSVRERKDGYEIEHRVVRKSTGEIRYVHEKCDHVRDSSGDIVRSEGMVQDITDRKIDEEKQKQLMEEMKHFAYIVSHDLRAPLSNIKGFSRELQDAIGVLGPIIEKALPMVPDDEREEATLLLREDLTESVNFINSSVTRMDHLIERMLRLSRVGRMDLVFQPLDMNELTANVLATFAHELQDKTATVSVAGLPETVADPTAMEQIMSNLIGNAIKYRDEDRPLEICIAGHRFSRETVFVVRDTGGGIAAADQNRIFQVFQRATRQNVPGEGMGLAFVRTLVRRHRGRIWCESEPGVGSTFTFTISNNLENEKPAT